MVPVWASTTVFFCTACAACLAAVNMQARLKSRRTRALAFGCGAMLLLAMLVVLLAWIAEAIAVSLLPAVRALIAYTCSCIWSLS